jgi:uncharacterized repeat protein (TIGR03803 family)
MELVYSERTMNTRNLLVLALMALCHADAQTANARTEIVLHNFVAPAQGATPAAALAHDSANNLYGTTLGGGAYGEGTAFKISASGQHSLLHSFSGGADGANPQGGITVDGAGNLYGTAGYGGTYNAGVIYKITPAGEFSILYNFTGAADGAGPNSTLSFGSAGDIYGTTSGGGAGSGVVYKLDPAGQQTVLHTFTGGLDGGYPQGRVTLDTAGNLYGTATEGGASFSGVVYQIDPRGEQTILHNFTGGADGGYPTAGVVLDPAGNLFGTALFGGSNYGGVIYKITPAAVQSVIFNFDFVPDGSSPQAGVVLDSEGNFYGTTSEGGPEFTAYGVVYKVTPAGQETVLYSFPGGSSGEVPLAGVIRDAAGNLYGTTIDGGAGYGVVYRISPTGQETVLFTFPGVTDGLYPYDTLARDSQGNLYGTTYSGGVAGDGAVFQVSPSGVETVLHSFAGGSDGATPYAGVALDSGGNLYGTTESGGAENSGIVYKVNAAGEESVLYSFTGGPDGGVPYAGVVLDAAGNMYGAASFGGAFYGGVVYKLTSTGHETVLYNFTGGADGGSPYGTPTLDKAGNVYGTTPSGGSSFSGVVYQVDPAGIETVLYNFTGGADGGRPQGGVVFDRAGNLYGTTPEGGLGFGTVYKVEPTGVETVLYAFTGGADGGDPQSGVVLDKEGNMYGAAPLGNLGFGVVFKVTPTGEESVLYSFSYLDPGSNPDGGVILDAAGNLYGTTNDGGKRGGGVVFVLPVK